MLVRRRRSATRPRLRGLVRASLFVAVLAAILFAADQSSRLTSIWQQSERVAGNVGATVVRNDVAENEGFTGSERPALTGGIDAAEATPTAVTLAPAPRNATGTATNQEAIPSTPVESARQDVAPAVDPVMTGFGPDPAAFPPSVPSVFETPVEAPSETQERQRSERVVAVRRGDTLMDILLSVGVSRAEAHEAVSALSSVFDPRALKPGQEITFTFAPGDGQPLVGAWLAARADRDVGLTREPGGKFVAQQRDKMLTLEPVRATGMVSTSLYEAGLAAGVPIQIMAELIRAFSFDVDFQREIQPGDAFEILFERFRGEDGRITKEGALRYATLLLSGRRMAIYRYADREGTIDYYNEKGESVRKALLKTPIDGARLTSGFGSRMHPILGYSAFHKGVDFGAATGTPIQAAGDGVVEMKGWFGGYGNYVRIRHNGEYSTAYAHLSRFAPGIADGTRVRQGQIIGYVGSTGRSTGPHLHYEVMRRGAQINPMGVKFPTGRRLEGVDLLQFKHARVEIDRWLVTAQTAVRVAARPPEPRPVD